MKITNREWVKVQDLKPGHNVWHAVPGQSSGYTSVADLPVITGQGVYVDLKNGQMMLKLDVEVEVVEFG